LRLDDFIHALQDKNVDLRRVMQEMRKAGATIEDAQDAYTVEELSASRKAEQRRLDPDTVQTMTLASSSFASRATSSTSSCISSLTPNAAACSSIVDKWAPVPTSWLRCAGCAAD